MGWTWNRTSALCHGALRRKRFSRLARVLVCALVGAVSLLSVSPPSVHAQDDSSGLRRAKFGKRLEARLKSAPSDERIRFSVVLKDPGIDRSRARRRARRRAISLRQQGVLNRFAPGEFRLRRRYENLAGFSGSARPAVIERLRRHPDVAHVYVDGRVRKNTNQGRAMVGVSQAFSAGFDGSTFSVAVLDSGIDTDHPDLADNLVEERCWCRSNNFNPSVGCCPGGGDTQSGPGSAEDDDGHGTSVSGILTSNGSVASMGVAPASGIVALKVLDESGGGSFSDVASALDWIMTNYEALNIRVVNMSLGDGDEYSSSATNPCSGSNTANAIADLTAAGVAVFAASGNDAYTDGISFPACVADAISVGGVYDASLGNVSWCGETCSTTLCTDSSTAADDFVCHTNSDELLDLLAPDYATATSGLAGSSTIFSGTSAASPYAAALGLLLFEQDPTLTVAELKSLMKSHGPLVTNPANGLVHRRTDVTSLFAVCGNGTIELGEDCDDGGIADGDCCSSACFFEGAASACSDGDACTSADACDGAGSCVSGSPLSCDDGLFCNGVESCESEVGCVSGIAPTADDGVACTVANCDESTDTIEQLPVDTLCDDGAFCNGAEVCNVGLGCESGPPPAVDDGIGCTSDLCDEVLDTVTHAPLDSLCDDGAFCTGVETCDPGLGCQSGSGPLLDDGIVCTEDSCDEVADVVTHTPLDTLCDDGTFCNGAEVCDEVLDCQPGTPLVLDDNLPCTLDACDESTQSVTHSPDDDACDDGDLCTVGFCDAVSGCSQTPIPGCVIPSVPFGGPGFIFWLSGALLSLGFWTSRRMR